jgi:hypothetical protein
MVEDEDCARLMRFWNNGIHFDFDAPIWIEQGGNNNHGCGGADVAEGLAVHASYRFPVFYMGKIHAGSDDVLKGCAGFC